MSICKAVIPAAGCGTRLLPFTLAAPKELLPVHGKPMIHLAVAEAAAAGIREIGIVIRDGKEVIREYFDALTKTADPSLKPLQQELARVELRFIRQRQPLGLGDALYEAGEFLRDSPFIMIIPDQFLAAAVPAARQLLAAAASDPQAVWSSLVEVPGAELPLFPGACTFLLKNQAGRTWEVAGLGGPPPEAQGTALLGFGRTWFPPGVRKFFSRDFLNPQTGEVDLLLSFQALIQKRRNMAVLLEGRAMDFGNWAGYEYFRGNYKKL
ncbi:MAG: sugar phosphate nucleotidyltransferase [Desulfobaccales bacterium]